MALGCAYEAASPLDAAVLAGVLKQAGIDSQIFGQALSGGIGELPAQGLVRVMVNTAQLEEARDIVAQWQQHIPDDEALAAAAAAHTGPSEDSGCGSDTGGRERQWSDWAFFVLLLIIGALIARLVIGD